MTMPTQLRKRTQKNRAIAKSRVARSDWNAVLPPPAGERLHRTAVRFHSARLHRGVMYRGARAMRALQSSVLPGSISP
jgi:hypothetical protein